MNCKIKNKYDICILLYVLFLDFIMKKHEYLNIYESEHL